MRKNERKTIIVLIAIFAACLTAIASGDYLDRDIVIAKTAEFAPLSSGQCDVMASYRIANKRSGLVFIDRIAVDIDKIGLLQSATAILSKGEDVYRFRIYDELDEHPAPMVPRYGSFSSLDEEAPEPATWIIPPGEYLDIAIEGCVPVHAVSKVLRIDAPSVEGIRVINAKFETVDG